MSSLKRRLRDSAKGAMQRLFVTGQAAGFDILPRHFYSNTPDIRHLSSTEYWRRPMSMVGVAGAAIEGQVNFVERCCPAAMQQELRTAEIHRRASELNGEPGYGVVEADFLYAFICAVRPPRILQVGAGVSTAVILLAAEKCGYRPEIVCIDPFPTGYLLRLAEAKQITLVKEAAQETDRQRFALNPGDLFFVDSTHTVKPGSEVNRMMLDILPDLTAGCYVHFHDICFPYDYPPTLFQTLFFWGESTLLHAFLVNNSRYRIAASLSMLHHLAPDSLGRYLPNYRQAPMKNGLFIDSVPADSHFPSSIFLQTVE